MRNFDFNRDGRVSPREARAANRAFAEWPAGAATASTGSRGAASVSIVASAAVVVERDGRLGSRRRCAAINFRQTAEGARMTMQEEVLFATDSDVLRPGAIERLRPLAGYLRANPGVRVSIDGHTDSRGSDAHNQDLSERRARASARRSTRWAWSAPASASAAMAKATRPRPTRRPRGMRLNRRVEVTLLGRRADEF